MAKDLNVVLITGRLGRDPELRYTPAGEAVCTFSVASSRPVKNEDEAGGWEEATEWVRVVLWRGLAERCAKQLGKGCKVYLEGRLQTREWTVNGSKRQRSTEVVAYECELLAFPRQMPQEQKNQQPNSEWRDQFSAQTKEGAVSTGTTQ